MQVKVTKTMANFLNSSIPEYSFDVELQPTWFDSDPTDYDMKTGKTKMIAVHYPAEYYSIPRYISTRKLSRCFRASDRSVEGFIEQVRKAVEI